MNSSSPSRMGAYKRAGPEDRAILMGKELLEGPGRVSKRLQVVEALDGKVVGIGIDVLANDLQPPVVVRDTSSTDRAKNSTARYKADPRWVAFQKSRI